MAKITSINPSNYEVIGEVDISTETEIKSKITAAHQAALLWKEIGIEGRIKSLENVYLALGRNQAEMAELASREMGMPIKDSRADAQDSLRYFRWYLDHAADILKPEVSYEDKISVSTVYREPYGVAAVIVPWNFPVSNVLWQVLPNLIAGNTVVFKDSEETPLCGKLWENIFQEANLPEGVFSEIYGDGKVGDILVHQDINLISFTGSSKTGHYLYKVAAEKFIPALLELGGSAPGIVFEDADIAQAADTIFSNRFLYGGQVCDGLKRLIVHTSKYDELITKLTKLIDQKKVGPAMNEDTDLGPLVAQRQVDLLADQVDDALRHGATLITGGKQSDHLTGAYYLPTVLTNIRPEMRVWREEVFGPVLPVVTFETDEEAISLANDTLYGLGSYLFTQTKERIKTVSSQLQAGMISVNGTTYLQPSSPFGGYKHSGLGREHGQYGLHDLTQLKVIAKSK